MRSSNVLTQRSADCCEEEHNKWEVGWSIQQYNLNIKKILKHTGAATKLD